MINSNMDFQHQGDLKTLIFSKKGVISIIIGIILEVFLILILETLALDKSFNRISKVKEIREEKDKIRGFLINNRRVEDLRTCLIKINRDLDKIKKKHNKIKNLLRTQKWLKLITKISLNSILERKFG